MSGPNRRVNGFASNGVSSSFIDRTHIDGMVKYSLLCGGTCWQNGLNIGVKFFVAIQGNSGALGTFEILSRQHEVVTECVSLGLDL